MIAYKFLGPGRIGAFSGFAWPEREWVEAEPDACRTGIHACERADLPYWLNAQLWQIELEGARRAKRKLVAPRGRLHGQVEGWNEESRRHFADACVDRLRSLAESSPEAAGYVPDAERRSGLGDTAMVAFIAARAAEIAGGPDAYEAERRRQADWLVERLDLAQA
ncbi:MAG: hypothetical protein ACRDNB_09150 [Gaiellaceae bacterium]